jgi:hypothetical protein
MRHRPPGDEAKPAGPAQPAATVTEETSRRAAAPSLTAGERPADPSSAAQQEIPSREIGADGKPRRKILRVKKKI